MKLSLKVLGLAIVAAPFYALTGCSAPSGFTYQNVSVAISVQCADCGAGPIYNPAYPAPANIGDPAPAGSVITEPLSGQGGVYVFTATVKNAPANVTWSLYPSPNLVTPNPPPTSTSGTPGESGSSVGTIQVQSGNTVYYSVPGGPPVYSGAALQQAQALGIPQGMVMLVASVPNDPGNPASVTTASQLIQLYTCCNSPTGPPTVYLSPSTPSSPSGLTNPAVAVAQNGGTFQFYGGAIAAPPCTTTSVCTVNTPSGTVTYPMDTVDNNVVWAVGPQPYDPTTAIVGGNSTYGTISKTGLYTAPAAVPPTQPVVYIWSELVPTVRNHALIAIN